MNQLSDFEIEISEEFDFNKISFAGSISQNKWVKNQWPIVYFIQNKQKNLAYVGESTNALSRIANHLNNKERQVLNKISIIGSDKFNKSATLHIESQLIQYISSEGTYSLQNGNNGLSFHNYYQRHLYGSLFKEVWRKLLERKVVNKSLKEIQNSDFFKYSPYKSLNQDQYDSVIEIIENLNKRDSAHIFVKGSAGTGKTILATYLIKLLNTKYDELNVEEIGNDAYQEIELLASFRKKYPNPKIGLVIAMASLRETLQKVFDKIPGLDRSLVISPSDTFKRKYDILIIDEAHRLRQRKNISWMGVFTANNKKLQLGNEGTELDWILSNSSHQIFFYDSAQSVKPSDIPHNKFRVLLDEPSTIKLELKSQMRVDGGADYITFVDDLLNCRSSEVRLELAALKYELRVFESFKELYAELGKREKEFKLCRLVAGYAWPWVSQSKEGENYDIEIEGLRFYWNREVKDWINSENSFKEVGCIHTTQGYDLNYVGVIFGKEISYNPETGKIEINPKNYFDRNGKAGITNAEDLKEYIINIYKTLMYRGIKGTYLYACDENLRKYLQKYIANANSEKSLKALPSNIKLPSKEEETKSFKILPFEEVQPFINSVPLYDIKVAAGTFSELQQSTDFTWIELPEPHKPSKDYFVCQIVGESMNKVIPNGSWCLFKKDSGGSREGKVVLVQHHNIHDLDFGSGYTIKLYHSDKEINQEGWSHKTIILKPQSTLPKYNEIVLHQDELATLKVVGLFVCILK